MSKTVDGIEEPALKEAQEILGTSSSRDTVNAALKEIIRRNMVDRFVAQMSSRSPEELEQMRADAWR